jgi:hypothetical protein
MPTLLPNQVFVSSLRDVGGLDFEKGGTAAGSALILVAIILLLFDAPILRRGQGLGREPLAKSIVRKVITTPFHLIYLFFFNITS